LRLDNETLFDELTSAFILRHGEEQQQDCRFRDSFDWRLYREDLLLCDEGIQWRLVRRGDGEELARARVRGNGDGPRRVSQLPPGRLRDRLEKLLDMRALLPLATVRRHRRELTIENDDVKTVVRLTLECWTIEGAVGEERLLRLEEMRGYGEEFAAVQAMLPRLGLGVAAGLEQVFALALRAVGREPLDYSAKFQAALMPEMASGHALRQIGAILLDTMHRNEQGIIADIDTEFLHDFRVAVRRTRAALGQFKGVLAPAVLEWLLAEFSWLGRLSNGARDLDVLLHSENAWGELLPSELRPGLHPFFTGLARQRRREYRQLVQALGSERYRELVRRWQEILRGEGGEAAAGPQAGRPTLRLARRVIKRRWRRILTDGAAIDETSPPATLHQLRIQGKKLRYALEFFRSVLPEAVCRDLIVRLKQLQDNLGRYNDLSVQEGVVRDYLAGLGTRDKDVAAAAAAGGLLASLDRERLALRQEFATVFAAFAGEETTGLMTALLEDAAG